MSISLSILQTILLTSAIILVVWLANNALGSRTGYRWRKILWLILALRLLLPVPLNITSLVPQVSRLEVNLPIAPQAPLRFFERFNIGGINSPDVPSPVTGNTPDNISDNTNDNNSSQGINPTQNTDNPAANSFDTGIKAFVFKTFFGSFASLFAAIWAIGFAAIAIMRLIQYSRLKKHLLKESTIDTNETVYRLLKKRAAATMDAVCIEFGIQKPLEIIISESLRSPMLFGYSNTRLLLPKNNYNEKELDSILRHELTHYKNRDLWYKLLMLFTCDLYWFNPLLRLMKISSNGKITSGNIIFKNRDITYLSEIERRKLAGSSIAMIFQNATDSFCPIRKIGEQIYEAVIEHKKCSYAEFLEQAKVIIKKINLDESVLNQYPFKLSGGMGQRVGILSAMILNPDILLADEPTSALDTVTQVNVIEELLNLRRENNLSIVIVTHHIGVAYFMGDYILVMKNGKAVEFGTKEEIFSSPKNEYTKELLK